MDTKILVEAITKTERQCSAALQFLRDAIVEGHAEQGAMNSLRDGVELIRCLRRLVAERTPDEIHRAFGAPGDFGYETPIGDALARVYGIR